jgi:hypothetical protein
MPMFFVSYPLYVGFYMHNSCGCEVPLHTVPTVCLKHGIIFKTVLVFGIWSYNLSCFSGLLWNICNFISDMVVLFFLIYNAVSTSVFDIRIIR